MYFIILLLMQANPNHVAVRTQRYCLFAKLQADRIFFQLICKDLKVDEYNYYSHSITIRSKSNNEKCLQWYFQRIKESLKDQQKHILDMRKMTILFPFIKYSDPHTNNGENQLYFTFRLCQDVDKDAIIKKIMKIGSSEPLITAQKRLGKQNQEQLNKSQPAKSAKKRQYHSSKNVKRNTQRAKQSSKSSKSSESEHKGSEAVNKTKKIKKPDMKNRHEVKQKKAMSKKYEQGRKSAQYIKSNKLYSSQIKNRSEINPKSDYKRRQKLNESIKKEPSTSTSIQEITFKKKQLITCKQKQKTDIKNQVKNKNKQVQALAERQVKIQEQQMIMAEQRAETKWKSDLKNFNKFCICGSYVYFRGNNQWTQIAINIPICAADLVSSFKIQIKTCQFQEICVGVVTDWGLLSPCTEPRKIQDSLRHVEPPCSRYLIGRFNQGDIVECKIQWVSSTISWYVNDYKRAQLKVQWLKKWELFPCIQMKTKGDIIRWLY